MDHSRWQQVNQVLNAIQELTQEERSTYLDQVSNASDPALRMSSSRWQQVKEVLYVVLDLAAADRPAYLDQIRGRDPVLCAEVELFLTVADDKLLPSVLISPRHHLAAGAKLG